MSQKMAKNREKNQCGLIVRHTAFFLREIGEMCPNLQLLLYLESVHPPPPLGDPENDQNRPFGPKMGQNRQNGQKWPKTWSQSVLLAKVGKKGHFYLKNDPFLTLLPMLKQDTKPFFRYFFFSKPCLVGKSKMADFNQSWKKGCPYWKLTIFNI